MSNVFGSLYAKLFGRSAVAAGAVFDPAGKGGDRAENAVHEVWLYPDSEALQKQTLLQARQIEQPVFRIGRRISDAIHYPHENPPDLLIAENPPFTLSRLHCEIEINAGKVVVRDLGSLAGTAVGNKRLRSNARKSTSMVVPEGSHSLVLGQRDGPFRFRLVVS